MQLIAVVLFGEQFSADEQINEDDVRRIDESHVLPTLQQQRSVDSSQPRDGIRRCDGRALLAKKLAEAGEELTGGRLDDRRLFVA